MMKKQAKLNQEGFTIIELMIATTVLAVILVLVTVLMISIGNLYYKGVSQARVQDDVRSVTDELSQHLQLTSFAPAQSNSADPKNTFLGLVPVSAYCIGSTRYSYVVGVQIGTTIAVGSGNSFKHILWRDTIPTGADCLAANLTASTPVDANGNGTNGTELIAPRSRLTQFCIGAISPADHTCVTNTNSPYTIEVGMAYGDGDLLNNASPSNMSDLARGLNYPNATCIGATGDQFCSTAYLNTTVVRRLTDSSI
jgi:prepilin-type N-terminal cleavage/methylation domain-containing protein